MKLLLYCTKAKPYLYPHFNNLYFTKNKDFGNIKLNGKIVAECDFEVEEIFRDFIDGKDYTINPNGVWVKSYYFKTKTLYANELYNKCCLNLEQMYKYFDDKNDKLVGYAIHIKNLHIFDKPKELSEYMNGKFEEWDYRDLTELKKAPQNMQYVSTWYCDEISMSGSTYILISIKPEWLRKILNGEKTIEVRKKVLKEML